MRAPASDTYDYRMLTASKLTCTATSLDPAVFECTLPPADLLAWASALSGLFSVGLAAYFGFWSIKQAQKAQKRADIAEQRVRIDRVASKVVDAINELSRSDSFTQEQLDDLPLALGAFNEAMRPLGGTYAQFAFHLAELALLPISYLQNCITVQEDETPNQLFEMGMIQALNVRSHLSNLRSSINEFVYSDTDSAREKTLESMTESIDRLPHL